MIVAHVFLAPYTLPVPFWLYLYGCAAALVLSFALLAYLATASPQPHEEPRREPLAGGPVRKSGVDIRGAARWSGAALVVTIATGFAGPADPRRMPE
jgi:hypothetical protein